MLFGVFLTAMIIHIFFMFPETAGKTLEEVEEMFLSGTKAWQTKVDYHKSRQAELGEIDPEKRMSYAGKHGDINDGEAKNVMTAQAEAKTV